MSRKFSQKFNNFFQTVILKGEVLGPVAHYFYKKEYQAWGAPHYHILMWMGGAPIAGKDEPEEVLRWIQNRITCRIPEEDSNPELHQLVTKYLHYKCSGYCQRRKKVKGTYITHAEAACKILHDLAHAHAGENLAGKSCNLAQNLAEASKNGRFLARS